MASPPTKRHRHLIRRNVVTGIGATTGAAQNGVQIALAPRGRSRQRRDYNVWGAVYRRHTCAARSHQHSRHAIRRVRSPATPPASPSQHLRSRNMLRSAQRNLRHRCFRWHRSQAIRFPRPSEPRFNGPSPVSFSLATATSLQDNVIAEAAIGVLKDTVPPEHIARTFLQYARGVQILILRCTSSFRRSVERSPFLRGCQCRGAILASVCMHTITLIG